MTPQAPMRHTARLGIVCAILCAVLILVGIGFAAGYLVGQLEAHSHACAASR